VTKGERKAERLKGQTTHQKLALPVRWFLTVKASSRQARAYL